MEKTYTTSRLAGNWIFRPTVSLTPTGVRYIKPKFFGGSEELIHFKHIASVRMSSGMLFSTVSIETSGGSAPVTISGLRNSDARELCERIEKAQASH